MQNACQREGDTEGLKHLRVIDLHTLVPAEGEIHRLVLVSGTDDGLDLDTALGDEGDLESDVTVGELLAHSEKDFGVKLRSSY